MLDKLLGYVLGQSGILRQHPALALALVSLGGLLGWWLAGLLYGERIKTLDAKRSCTSPAPSHGTNEAARTQEPDRLRELRILFLRGGDIQQRVPRKYSAAETWTGECDHWLREVEAFMTRHCRTEALEKFLERYVANRGTYVGVPEQLQETYERMVHRRKNLESIIGDAREYL